MNKQGTLTDRYQLESGVPFSKSLLWTLQKKYFTERGVNAWRQGEVPHYVTSNLTVANTYAELVFAFLRDGKAMRSCYDPFYICELGSGSGRLAFHFLQRLQQLCSLNGVPIISFKYIMTDFTQSNLDFWKKHSKFQEWLEKGILDVALLDVTETDRLELQLCGETIAQGSLKQPLTVIANYLFDSIPQELYYFENKRCLPCTISLHINEDPANMDPGEVLGKLRCKFNVLEEEMECEDELRPFIDFYREKLNEKYLLFPREGLKCLNRLSKLSEHGMMLLSADKGNHRLEEAADGKPPSVVRHGSFSVNVNYNAFRLYCEQKGGVALFADKHHNSLNFGCLLFMEKAEDYCGTISAYHKYVEEFSPDDFYSITKHARQYIPFMTVEDILAYLRLSRYDSHQFGRYLPRLLQLTDEMDSGEHKDMLKAIERVWELYLPLGEDLDLAYEIGNLLYGMNEFHKAIEYYEHSNKIYGVHDGTKCNIALCYHMLNRFEEAEALLIQLEEKGYESRELKELLAIYRVNRECFGNLIVKHQNS